MATTLTIPRPDDWHVHLRDGEVLRTVLPHTGRHFARAIVMPNLKSPVTTAEKAHAYREEIIAATPKGMKFTPLMTIYLTDTTHADDLAKGHAKGVVTAAKLYPANATTNSQHGVTNIKNIYPVLEKMQEIGMPLLVHGEVTDPDVDVFDREAVFIDRVMTPMRKDFPKLKVVFEHITTKEAADYVSSEGKSHPLAATVTVHHLMINRNAIFQGGIRPHFYCLPIAKREKHREALIKAATSGGKMFFLGTDTAPHTRANKESACGCAGIFSAPNALAQYVQVFDEAGALANLESFASRNGPAFYGLPVNKETLTLTKETAAIAEIKPILTGNDEHIVAFAPPSPVFWKVVDA
ncbi:MAG TPA: dihydroorotase [Alphaproteobacteria bacterium]|nr:dihydroorotase [Alphaproteobacteria bacterium]